MTSFLLDAGKLLQSAAITARNVSYNKWKRHLEVKMKIFHNKNNNNGNNDPKKRTRCEREVSEVHNRFVSKSARQKKASEKYRQYRQLQRRHRRRAAILRKIYRHYLSRKKPKQGKRRKRERICSCNHSKSYTATKNLKAKEGEVYSSRMEKQPVGQFSRTNLSAGATAAYNDPERGKPLGRNDYSQLPKKRPIWFITGGFEE